MPDDFVPNDTEVLILRHLCGGMAVGPTTAEILPALRGSAGRKALAHLNELGLVAKDDRRVYQLTPAGRNVCRQLP
jgi:hypothetical protein